MVSNTLTIESLSTSGTCGQVVTDNSGDGFISFLKNLVFYKWGLHCYKNKGSRMETGTGTETNYHFTNTGVTNSDIDINFEFYANLNDIYIKGYEENNINHEYIEDK